MSVNPQLDYASSVESNLVPESRKLVYIRPSQGELFVANQVIRLNIPNTGLVDLSQSYLEMRIRKTSGGASAFIAHSAWSVIRKIQFFSGDGNLLEEIDRAHLLFAKLANLHDSSWQTSMGAITMGIDSIVNKQANFVAGGKLYTLDLSLMGIFAMVQYLPVFLLRNSCYILIELESDANCISKTVPADADGIYEVSQVRLALEMVNVRDEFKQVWLNSLAKGGSIMLPYESFQFYPDDEATALTQKQLKFGFYKSNLKAVVLIPRLTADVSLTTVNQFRSNFDLLTSIQVKLGDRNFPEELLRLDLSAAPAYKETLKSLSIHAHEGTNIGNNYHTAVPGGNGEDFFVAIPLNSRNDSLQASGINSKLNPVSMSVEVNRSAAGTGAKSWSAYGHYNAILEISSVGMRKLD